MGRVFKPRQEEVGAAGGPLGFGREFELGVAAEVDPADFVFGEVFDPGLRRGWGLGSHSGYRLPIRDLDGVKGKKPPRRDLRRGGFVLARTGRPVQGRSRRELRKSAVLEQHRGGVIGMFVAVLGTQT
jgi:hypothetical protein